MAMASSLPIIRFTENVIAKVAAVGNGTPASWWLAILTLGPLRVAIWRGRNFAVVPFPRSLGTDADRRSSVYVAPLSGQLNKSQSLANRVTVCERRLATKRDHPDR
jgi:hypothetical protein